MDTASNAICRCLISPIESMQTHRHIFLQSLCLIFAKTESITLKCSLMCIRHLNFSLVFICVKLSWHPCYSISCLWHSIIIGSEKYMWQQQSCTSPNSRKLLALAHSLGFLVAATRGLFRALSSLFFVSLGEVRGGRLKTEYQTRCWGVVPNHSLLLSLQFTLLSPNFHCWFDYLDGSFPVYLNASTARRVPFLSSSPYAECKKKENSRNV